MGIGPLTARTVLLATGVVNRRPPMDEELHDEALARGLIRYCPICDGYEVTDKRVGVIGSGDHGVAEAVFLRGYTADVTLIAPDGAHDLAAADQRGSNAPDRAVDGPWHAVAALNDAIVVETPARPSHVRQRLSGARLRHAHRAGRADRRGADRRRRLHRRRCAPAHQRARPLCGRRRRARARPDQPRHGRRRGRRDDDPQRPGEGEAAACAKRGRRGRRRSCRSPESATPVAERDQGALAVGALRSRAGRRRRNSRPRPPCRALRRPRITQGRPIRSA